MESDREHWTVMVEMVEVLGKEGKGEIRVAEGHAYCVVSTPILLPVEATKLSS